MDRQDEGQHRAECLERYLDLKRQARKKYFDMVSKIIPRSVVERWLNSLDPLDAKTLRGYLNRLRKGEE